MLNRVLSSGVFPAVCLAAFFPLHSVSLAQGGGSDTVGKAVSKATLKSEKRKVSNTVMVNMVTSHGEIKIELNKEKAPVSVENFVKYVKSGHYDGTIFHRVMEGFMIQGGGFAPGLQQKPTQAPIVNEAKNGLKNERGTLAMARTSAPDSATAQFFINLVDNVFLNASAGNAGYAVFGKVTEGMDVVDKIAKVKTGNMGGHQNVPREDVVIQSVQVVD